MEKIQTLLATFWVQCVIFPCWLQFLKKHRQCIILLNNFWIDWEEILEDHMKI